MMPHSLVAQLRFTRSEFQRGLVGLDPEDACKRLLPMNCISWNVGHLAWQEQRYFLDRAQGQVLYPALNQVYAYGAPMTTPSLAESLAMWQAVTAANGPYLDQLTTTGLQAELLHQGQPVGQTVGSALRRLTYHYWYHIGEIQAIRQLLGHTGLPEYVGDIEGEAPYRAES
jgi:hypothetical protein